MKELVITVPIVNPLEFKEIDFKTFLILKSFLETKGELVMNIKGVSMNPVLYEKDCVSVVPTKSLNSLKRFDVIIFWQNNILICHYFWRTNTYFQNNSSDLDSKILTTRPLNPLRGYDHPIKMSEILGIVPMVKINWWLKLKIILYNRYFTKSFSI